MAVKIRDKNKIPDITKILGKLTGLSVEIGIFGDDDSHILMIARVHEFGCRIEVTEKMRGWFRWQGYPLSPDTKEINIPERSFMRSGFDENERDLISAIERLLQHVINLKLSPNDFYERIGTWLVSRIQNKLRSLSDPPLSSMTIERKGSSSPLIDTGRLISSITYRVVGR